MDMPAALLRALAELNPREVSFGYGGLKLLGIEELAEGQVGYALGIDDQSLSGSAPGDWRREWIVFCYDTGLGDPIFVDSGSPEFPVFTAMHGEGAWEPKPVAISLEAFRECWDEFARIANGRSNPVELEANPLSKAARQSFLNGVRQINGSRIDAELWVVLVDDGDEFDS